MATIRLHEGELNEVIKAGLKHTGRVLRAFGPREKLYFVIGVKVKLLDDGKMEKQFCLIVSNDENGLPDTDRIIREK